MTGKPKLRNKLFIIILVLILILLIPIFIKIQQNVKSLEKIKELPNFSFTTLENKIFTSDSLESNMNTIIMIYSADCIHCLSSFNELIDLIEEEQSIQILMVSSDSIKTINHFKARFDLDNNLSIIFTQCEEIELYKIFGYYNYPTLYLYNKNNRLIKRISEDVSYDMISNLFGLNK